MQKRIAKDSPRCHSHTTTHPFLLLLRPVAKRRTTDIKGNETTGLALSSLAVFSRCARSNRFKNSSSSRMKSSMPVFFGSSENDLTSSVAAASTSVNLATKEQPINEQERGSRKRYKKEVQEKGTRQAPSSCDLGQDGPKRPRMNLKFCKYEQAMYGMMDIGDTATHKRLVSVTPCHKQ